MQLTRQVQSIGYTWRVSVKFILDKGKRICNIPASIAFVLPQRHKPGSPGPLWQQERPLLRWLWYLNHDACR